MINLRSKLTSCCRMVFFGSFDMLMYCPTFGFFGALSLKLVIKEAWDVFLAIWKKNQRQGSIIQRVLKVNFLSCFQPKKVQSFYPIKHVNFFNLQHKNRSNANFVLKWLCVGEWTLRAFLVSRSRPACFEQWENT